ncbi:Uncharacterised protein [Mycobacteroides abscessus subsp. abscessus]|nr:Uncharacterised protein [Mycobacteroides abscessus subsp. abscessus]
MARAGPSRSSHTVGSVASDHRTPTGHPASSAAARSAASASATSRRSKWDTIVNTSSASNAGCLSISFYLPRSADISS